MSYLCWAGTVSVSYLCWACAVPVLGLFGTCTRAEGVCVLLCPTGAVPVPAALPCQLTCRPVGQHFTAVLSDTVVDGTPCQLDSDICINGKCRVRQLMVRRPIVAGEIRQFRILCYSLYAMPGCLNT